MALSVDKIDKIILMQRFAGNILRRKFAKLYPEDIEDVLQSTMLSILKSQQNDRDVQNLQAWYFKSVFNQAGKFMRSITRQHNYGYLSLDMPYIDIEDRKADLQKAVEESHLLQSIFHHVAYMSTDKVEIFILKFLEEMDYAGIEKVTGIKEATARQHISRIRKSLLEDSEIASHVMQYG